MARIYNGQDKLRGYNMISAEPIDTRLVLGDRLQLDPNVAYNGMVVFDTGSDALYLLEDSENPQLSESWSVVTTGNIDTSSLATTGSNNFFGDQNIDGDAVVLVNFNVGVGDPVLAQPAIFDFEFSGSVSAVETNFETSSLYFSDDFVLPAEGTFNRASTIETGDFNFNRRLFIGNDFIVASGSSVVVYDTSNINNPVLTQTIPNVPSTILRYDEDRLLIRPFTDSTSPIDVYQKSGTQWQCISNIPVSSSVTPTRAVSYTHLTLPTILLV